MTIYNLTTLQLKRNKSDGSPTDELYFIFNVSSSFFTSYSDLTLSLFFSAYFLTEFLIQILLLLLPTQHVVVGRGGGEGAAVLRHPGLGQDPGGVEVGQLPLEQLQVAPVRPRRRGRVGVVVGLEIQEHVVNVQGGDSVQTFYFFRFRRPGLQFEGRHTCV